MGKVIDGDTIAREIFAATRRAGRQDTFLSQELADGVMHFLRGLDESASALEIREAAVAAIRSLGHPLLATFVSESLASCVDDQDEKPVDSIYPSNLLAAEEAGLITIGDKERPTTLTGGVLDPPAVGTRVVDWVKRLLDARLRFERFVVVDEIERHVADAAPVEWLDAFQTGLEASGLFAIVHLNRPNKPGFAPLFTHSQPTFWPEEEPDLSLRLLSAAQELGRVPIRWVWHQDENTESLAEALRLASTSGGLTLVGDRPRTRSWLAAGLPDGCPAVIQQTCLSLILLQNYLRERGDSGPFEERCNSLARLALATGHAKRRFLRTARADLRERFIIDRSCMTLTVEGLDEVSHEDRARKRAIIHQLETACTADLQYGIATVVLPEVNFALNDLGSTEESAFAESICGAPIRVEIAKTYEFNSEKVAEQLGRLWTSSKAESLRVVWAVNSR